jgi:hypothetical protein
MNAMRRAAPVLVALLASAGAASGQARIDPQSAEKAFAAGGRVWMDLSAGDYRIQAGTGDRVRVEWTYSDPDDVGSFKYEMRVEGRDLTLRTRGPRGGMRVVVEVPARSDLTVRLGAGDLRITDIEGSKDLSSWAGNIVVDVGTPDAYASVEASVTAGDLSAAPFSVNKSGLFRSFSWKGSGRYQLKVRLTAGDLELR